MTTGQGSVGEELSAEDPALVPPAAAAALAAASQTGQGQQQSCKEKSVLQSLEFRLVSVAKLWGKDRRITPLCHFFTVFAGSLAIYKGSLLLLLHSPAGAGADCCCAATARGPAIQGSSSSELPFGNCQETSKYCEEISKGCYSSILSLQLCHRHQPELKTL